MANLPSQHPSLALHLTDRALAPLITSAHTPQHQHLLTALSNTALNAHESATRLNLGIPQRIMVEHNDDGPLLLQTFLSPPTTSTPAQRRAGNSVNSEPQPQTTTPAIYINDENSHERPLSRESNNSETTSDSESEADDPDAAPMLVGIVVAATPDETPEARRAAVRLERVGREIQHRWTELMQTPQDAAPATATANKGRRGGAD